MCSINGYLIHVYIPSGYDYKAGLWLNGRTEKRYFDVSLLMDSYIMLKYRQVMTNGLMSDRRTSKIT